MHARSARIPLEVIFKQPNEHSDPQQFTGMSYLGAAVSPTAAAPAAGPGAALPPAAAQQHQPAAMAAANPAAALAWHQQYMAAMAAAAAAQQQTQQAPPPPPPPTQESQPAQGFNMATLLNQKDSREGDGQREMRTLADSLDNKVQGVGRITFRFYHSFLDTLGGTRVLKRSEAGFVFVETEIQIL